MFAAAVQSESARAAPAPRRLATDSRAQYLPSGLYQPLSVRRRPGADFGSVPRHLRRAAPCPRVRGGVRRVSAAMWDVDDAGDVDVSDIYDRVVGSRRGTVPGGGAAGRDGR